MKINANFEERVLIHSLELEWITSPMAGVDRRPLDRVGDEVARATSIVRYAPGSSFSSHIHTGGEEFLVIEGVFQDEHGDYPPGSYLRNPPKSSHTPGSAEGCVILVKLWQFDLDDRAHVRLRTDRMFSVPHKDWEGVCVTPLYQDEVEQVSILDLDANATLNIDTPKGAELFVMEGELNESGDELRRHSWLRVPVNSNLAITVGNNGAKVWLKQGHLNEVARQIENINKQYLLSDSNLKPKA
jgi:anti-sigma factor ChrR (cupin superfamily)